MKTINIQEAEVEAIKRLFEAYNAGTTLDTENYRMIECFIADLEEAE